MNRLAKIAKLVKIVIRVMDSSLDLYTKGVVQTERIMAQKQLIGVVIRVIFVNIFIKSLRRSFRLTKVPTVMINEFKKNTKKMTFPNLSPST